MAATTVRGAQVRDATIQRVDVDVATAGQALIRKVVQGTLMSISSTGADAGTGDATLNFDTAGGDARYLTLDFTTVGNASYTVLAADRVIMTTTTFTATRTFTLPLCSTFPTGVPLWIVDAAPAITASFFLILARNAADTIGKVATNLTFKTPGMAICLMGDGGTNWTIVESQGAGAISTSTYATPTGTTSSAGVMMGLAGSITPVTSGNVAFCVGGSVRNATAGGTTNVLLKYGTGTAPINGAAQSGTTLGNIWTGTSVAASNQLPFTAFGLATGLILGTAYWLDVAVAASGGVGTSSIVQGNIAAYEI
jgi:hypothetical protein